MGGTREFLQKLIRSGISGGISPELGQLESEYPTTLASGYWASGGRTSVLAVPSGKVFHLKTIWWNNAYTGVNYAFFYDGPGVSVSVGGIQIAQSATEFIGEEMLKGLIFASAVHISTLDSTQQIRIGGILRDS